MILWFGFSLTKRITSPKCTLFCIFVLFTLLTHWSETSCFIFTLSKTGWALARYVGIYRLFGQVIRITSASNWSCIWIYCLRRWSTFWNLIWLLHRWYPRIWITWSNRCIRTTFALGEYYKVSKVVYHHCLSKLSPRHFIILIYFLASFLNVVRWWFSS